jgi:hypothetical protein
MSNKPREIVTLWSAAPLSTCTAALHSQKQPVKGVTNAGKTLGNTAYTSPSPHYMGVSS